MNIDNNITNIKPFSNANGWTECSGGIRAIIIDEDSEKFIVKDVRGRIFNIYRDLRGDWDGQRIDNWKIV